MKYRKKPIEVEAFQLIEGQEWPEWAKKALQAGKVWGWIEVDGYLLMEIDGKKQASLGDWLVKGPNGHCYPKKEAHFADTYEAVDDPKA